MAYLLDKFNADIKIHCRFNICHSSSTYAIECWIELSLTRDKNKTIYTVHILTMRF